MRIVRHEGSDWPCCDVCGVPAFATTKPITVTVAKDEGASAICSTCQGLIDAGMLRPEMVDGTRRWRQWHFEWTPGELLGEIEP